MASPSPPGSGSVTIESLHADLKAMRDKRKEKMPPIIDYCNRSLQALNGGPPQEVDKIIDLTRNYVNDCTGSIAQDILQLSASLSSFLGDQVTELEDMDRRVKSMTTRLNQCEHYTSKQYLRKHQVIRAIPSRKLQYSTLVGDELPMCARPRPKFDHAPIDLNYLANVGLDNGSGDTKSSAPPPSASSSSSSSSTSSSSSWTPSGPSTFQSEPATSSWTAQAPPQLASTPTTTPTPTPTPVQPVRPAGPPPSLSSGPPPSFSSSVPPPNLSSTLPSSAPSGPPPSGPPPSGPPPSGPPPSGPPPSGPPPSGPPPSGPPPSGPPPSGPPPSGPPPTGPPMGRPPAGPPPMGAPPPGPPPRPR